MALPVFERWIGRSRVSHCHRVRDGLARSYFTGNPPALGLRPSIEGRCRAKWRTALTLCGLTVLWGVFGGFSSHADAALRPKHIVAGSEQSKTTAPAKRVLVIVPRGKPLTGRRRMLALLPRAKLADACRPVPVSNPFSAPPDALALAAIDATPIDVPRLKQAIELLRRGKLREVTEIQRGVHDPVVKKLIEWIVLRSEEGQAGFDRYAAFIRENPAWPGLSVLRKRAEAALWQENRDSRTVLGFLQGKPISPNGRLAFARALLSEGDRADAEREIRETWRSEELSPRLEEEILAAFPGVLTRDDHAARMDRRIGRKEFSTAMRAALRLGPSYTAVVKACAAVAGKDKKARELLDKVAAELRPNLGYVLCRVQWALDHDDAAQAARLVLDAPR